jgi:replication protein
MKAWYIGVLKCGRQHSCPVCAARKAAERADELDRMMRGDTPEAEWQMVTLTLRHHAGESLADGMRRLHSALRRTRTSRAVRAIFDARVTASVRATEVTYGGNGWHPHVHLLLRTSEWSAEERATLEREWLARVPGSPDRAVSWSTPIKAWHRDRARYLAKLGAEVAGVAKEPKNGNRTPWQIAESGLRNARDAALWREYQDTMKGRRLLEFDERAKALLERAPEAEEPLQEWRCDIFAEEFAAFVKLEALVPTILWELLETATHSGLDPPEQVRITIDDACQRRAA